MITIRPTQSLAKRMKIRLSESRTQSTTILGDWFAQDFVFEKRQLIFCMSENGRLPVIMPAAPYSQFPNRLADQVLHVLHEIGVESSKAKREWNQMLEFSVAKTNNRSVIGTMKQLRLDLEYSNPPGGLNREDPLSLSLFLARSAGTMTLSEFHPREAVLKLFGEQTSPIRTVRPRLTLVK
jgi:hypothetical protein